MTSKTPKSPKHIRFTDYKDGCFAVCDGCDHSSTWGSDDRGIIRAWKSAFISKHHDCPKGMAPGHKKPNRKGG